MVEPCNTVKKKCLISSRIILIRLKCTNPAYLHTFGSKSDRPFLNVGNHKIKLNRTNKGVHSPNFLKDNLYKSKKGPSGRCLNTTCLSTIHASIWLDFAKMVVSLLIMVRLNSKFCMLSTPAPIFLTSQWRCARCEAWDDVRVQGRHETQNWPSSSIPFCPITRHHQYHSNQRHAIYCY